MPLLESFYAGAVAAARIVSPALGLGTSKLARAVRARRGAVERLESWAGANRDRTRPLVWFHAPSVGEGLQARAVLERLQHLRPDVQTAYTHFSPSAEGLAARIPADVAGVLPWDLPGPMDRVLTALAPDLIAFTKTEVWPVLTRRAERRGVPMVLQAATLPRSSSRARGASRLLLAPAHRRLAAVLAIAAEDARRFAELGARRGTVEVTGDPAVDSAAERARAADPAAPYLAPFREAPAPTVVAGSTWPPDEAVLVPAVSSLRERIPGLRLVVAPHEPDPTHLEPLVARLRARGWTVATLGEVEEAGVVGEAGAVVVDRVGVLAHLYTIGSVAYVGGGFHGAGLHSVLEPAAAGIPVAFGPARHNARAAGELLGVGGAAEVGGVDDLRRSLEIWLLDVGERASASAAVLRYIERHEGAAVRTAEALLRYLPDTA